MAGLGFNPNDYEPHQGFEPLPNGDYVAMITEEEIKQTKAGTGQYLKFTWTVVDGQYTGRKLWSNHNIINPNETAQQIARQEISAIAHAIGRPAASTSEELVNVPCRITVRIKQEAGRDPSNEIKKWEAIGQQPFPAQATPVAPPQGYQQSPGQPAAAPQPPSGHTPPWSGN